MKVELDFKNLRDENDERFVEQGPGLEEHFKKMKKLAEEAKGFLFFVDKGETIGLQSYAISTGDFANLVLRIYENVPITRFVVENKLGR